MSVSAHADERPVNLLRYIDVLLVTFAAPVVLLIGAPALGYAVGAGAWIALRGVEVIVSKRAHALGEVSKELTARLLFALGRVVVLAVAIILLKKDSGKHDSLAALIVILFAFTVYLAISVVNRPGER